MDKLKRFIDCYIPTETCNLKCHYCYIAQLRKFNNKLAEFTHPINDYRRAFSQERLGGCCLINLCAGGETLLAHDVIELAQVILEQGHYLMIVTNGTLTKRFEELANFTPDLKRRLFFKFSFHYLEFKRLNKLNDFVSNVNLVKEAGCSFTIEVTPSDELIPYIEELKSFCIENFGALCHVTIARDDRKNGIDHLSDLSFDEYKKVWGQFESPLFNYKAELFYKKRNEFCYAGAWSVYVNIMTGDITQCYCSDYIGNIFDFDNPIKFRPVGKACSIAHCYNGHAFLALGDIPGLDTEFYDNERNRCCVDGSEWLQQEMKSFMHQHLKDNNEEWSDIKQNCYMLKRSLSKIKKNVKRKINKK